MNRYLTYTDEDLIPLLQLGESEALEVILHRHTPTLYRFINSHLQEKAASEELLQSVFISLWQDRENIVAEKLSALLYGYARNKILMYFRTEKRRHKYVMEFARMMQGAHDNSNEETQSLNDLRTTIENSIAQLPERCQTAFRLSRYENMPLPRIAEHMNISVRTVENYITTALKHLRTSLGEFMILIVWLLGKD